jgi:hypothetical protein
MAIIRFYGILHYFLPAVTMQKMLYCNPFSIHIASTDEDFCDRKKEKADLIRHAKNSNN